MILDFIVKLVWSSPLKRVAEQGLLLYSSQLLSLVEIL